MGVLWDVCSLSVRSTVLSIPKKALKGQNTNKAAQLIPLEIPLTCTVKSDGLEADQLWSGSGSDIEGFRKFISQCFKCTLY